MKPWGEFGWLVSWYPDREWVVVSCLGFEERSIGLPTLAQMTGLSVREMHCIRVSDPPNRHTEELEALTDSNQDELMLMFKNANIRREELFVPAQKLARFVDELMYEKDTSVLLDISSFPKRIGLFLLKQFYSHLNLRDLIVSYTPATGYREGYLARDVLPPSALPGYGLGMIPKNESTVIVSVGYSAFDLGDILQQTASSNVRFLMPFPPASPSFRKNWKFLKILNEGLETPVIERINANDTFAVNEWAIGHMDEEKTTTMIALGPKPHSFGLALAQISSNGNAELVYPQPQTYHPKSTYGYVRNPAGEPNILGYGLVRDGLRVLVSPEP